MKSIFEPYLDIFQVYIEPFSEQYNLGLKKIQELKIFNIYCLKIYYAIY